MLLGAMDILSIQVGTVDVSIALYRELKNEQ